MDYEQFKREILHMTGIDLSSYKEKQMKRRIESLIRKHGFEPYEEYASVLKTDKTMLNEFINYLTINVSEFYRNPEQWEVLENYILPAILSKTKKPVIWSAACSTGDEPYTLVMVLNKFLPLSEIRIIATDIDRGALDKAVAGIYNPKSMEKLPPQLLKTYFEKSGDYFKIKDEVKNSVTFKQHDLLKDEYPKEVDLIVCRNVLIYFTEEAKADIYLKFNRSLKKGAVLFVGSTEQIIGSMKYGFTPLKTFFYSKENEV